jgi:biopolymer transport protein ExbD
MRGRGLKRRAKAVSEIPSSSLADMAFLLLIFFMVSTSFPKEQPRTFTPPEAAATERLEEHRRDVLHVYVERDESIYINDERTPVEQVSDVLAPVVRENDRIVILIRSDRDVSYGIIDQVMKEFQQAGALRVSFYTHLEQRGVQEGG